MTMTFNSFGKFAEHLQKLAFKEYARDALEISSVIIEKDAKDEIGTYQRTNTGPFEPWAELADSTKAQRLSLGFSENEPLLRTGALRDSISHSVDVSGLVAYVGSTSPVMVWQELGTVTIPPRSVLGIAASRNKELIEKAIGNVTMSLLLDRNFSPFPFEFFI
jgi:hypothetical protein